VFGGSDPPVVDPIENYQGYQAGDIVTNPINNETRPSGADAIKLFADLTTMTSKSGALYA